MKVRNVPFFCSDIGCRAANGKNSYDAIVTAIWDEFINNRDSGVTDARGTAMRYWKATEKGMALLKDTAQTTGLIANHDSRCGGWLVCW